MSSALKGNLPKKQRIINAVSESIASGKLVSGEKLITVRELSDQFQISTAVVHQALRELSQTGLLESRPNAGFYVSESIVVPAPAKSTSKRSLEPKIFLSCGHHSDLIWKYSFGEYEKIREKQWDRIAGFFEKYPAFCAFVEQSEALRPYLDKHPEKIELFRKMAAEKRLSLTGGFVIPDLNMSCGELTVRNLQLGRKYYREMFGAEISIACMNDAFGMCGQLPQILKKSQYRYLLPGRMPNRPISIPGNAPFCWQGIDASTVTVIPSSGGISHTGYEINVPVVYSCAEELNNTIQSVKYTKTPGDLLVHYMTEEHLLQEQLFALLDNANREPEGRRIEFGSIMDYCDRIDSEQLPSFSGEFNPEFSGCYTTRITVKQVLRECENLLFTAEMLSAFGNFEYDLTPAWREMMLCSFHDALCGCHHDAVYDELMEKFQRVRQICDNVFSRLDSDNRTSFVTILNPDTVPGVKIVEMITNTDLRIGDFPAQRSGDRLFFAIPFETASLISYPCKEAAASPPQAQSTVFETDYFKVDFSSPFPKIESKIDECHHVFGDFFGEILFRRDIGTMWSESLSSANKGHEAQKESVVSILQGEVFTEVVTCGEVLPCTGIDGALENHWSGFGGLRFQKTYRFYPHSDHFSLALKLYFRGMNTKITIAFPLGIEVLQSNAAYDVPFGLINRKPYFEVKSKYVGNMQEFPPSVFRHASGDYPAQHYVDYCDNSCGVAIANDGVAGWQLNNGIIYGSLLRSGNGIFDGNMQPQQGAYDNGEHDYRFEICAHRPFDMEKAVACGKVLNRRACVLPGKVVFAPNNISLSAGNVVISSLRKVGDDWIVRLYETLGRETHCELKITDREFQLFESDLCEESWSEVSRKLKFAPMEIKTLKLSFYES